MEAFETAKNLCAEHGCALLYLTMSGSHLYGLNTPKSDTDYIGLFIQNPKDVLVGKRVDHIVRSTGNDKGKNTSEDTDMTLWNITYFLKTLLSRGDTGAIDLFYAIKNGVNVVYNYEKPHLMFHEKPFSEHLGTERDVFFDPLKAKSFVGYATTQATRYGVKGERLEVMKNVHDWVHNTCFNPEELLKDYMEEIVKEYKHDKYFFLTETNGVPSVNLCGKIYMGTINMEEFYDRVKAGYAKYGHRSHSAAEAGGVDWKAMSHAVRVLMEYKELLETGTITFPIPEENAVILKGIKTGAFEYDAVTQLLDGLFADIEGLTPCEKVGRMAYDEKEINAFILEMYEGIFKLEV